MEGLIDDGGRQSIEPATEAERTRLEGMAVSLEANPSIRSEVARCWQRWRKGLIIAPGTIDGRMQDAYYQGFSLGLREALGAIWLMERVMEAAADGEDGQAGA